MDSSYDSTRTALKYTKMKGFATTHGQEFEWTLSALLHLRGCNSNLEFQLGTNVQGAGALDDIVFRLKHTEGRSAWQTTYVQLKHKEKKWLSRSMLTNPKGDFSLPSYFKSYCEIKDAMSTAKKETLFDGSLEDCLFVIFTNAKGNDDLGEKRSRDFSQAEEFLWSGSGSVFSFEDDKDMLECLGECGDDGIKFLKQLRVFCGQPSANMLKETVKEELLAVEKEKIKNLNIDRLCECYLGYVKIWWETMTDILHRGHNLLERALDKVRLESCSEQTLNEYKLELSFEDAALLELNSHLLQDKNSVAHVMSADVSSFQLTLTKLWQTFRGQSIVLSCERLIAHKRALLAECLQGNVKRLILCTRDWSMKPSNEYFEVINNIIARKDSFFVVFLSDGSNGILSELTARFQGGCTGYVDSFLFSQLKEVSRIGILDKKVTLQGHDIPLKNLLSEDYESLDRVLNATVINDVIGCVGSLIVGSPLPVGIGYYVDRTLEQALCVKTSIFQAIRGTVTIGIAPSEASARGLLEKALEFLLSQKFYPSLNHDDVSNISNELVQSPLVPDENIRQVFIGLKLCVGMLEWNFVGLRFGQENVVTALLVCPNKEACQQGSFLFVSNETNEDDVRKLSEFYKSNHLFSLRNGQLRWVQSYEDIELIRKHIDQDQVSRLAPETVMNVEDRLVLACAEPGMGKSTLMARLAKNTKAALPHYFVISIALNDHTELFHQGKHADVLGFLSNAIKMESSLQRTLLKYALEISGNIIIIADGFDEIAPRYVKECCNLLSRLLDETKTRKIWMTSRNSVKQIIETHFSKFSVKLCEFDKESQKTFFKAFWDNKSKLSESNLDEFIEQLLEISSQDIQDKESNFLGIPLQCQMLAEVFEDHVNGSAKNAKLPNKLDLFSLLEMFVDKKCGVFVQNKLRTPIDDTNFESLCADSRKMFIDSHSKAGLMLILGENGLKTYGMEQILKDSLAFCEEIQLGKDKTGFIVDIVNGMPRFIHRIFAEYFMANWISKHLADSAELIKSKLFTADFAVIRCILNGILCKSFALHTAVLHENADEVEALLESDDIDVEAKDDGGRTALHLAAGLGTSEEREENERRIKILDLIINKTSDFKVVDKVLCGSPLRSADITRTWIAIDKLLCRTDENGELCLTLKNVRDNNMLDIIFQQDLAKLLGLCLDNGLPVEHLMDTWFISDGRLLVRACKEGSIKVASLLIERNADINQTLDEDDGNSPLVASSYSGHLEIVKLLHQKCVSNASVSYFQFVVRFVCCRLENYLESSKFINIKTREGMTAMHHAAKGGCSDVISFLISHGGDIQSRDPLNRTPLHLAAVFQHPSAVRVLLQAMEEADRAAAVNSCDKKGDSVLISAARVGSVECVEILLQAGGKLYQTGWNGETPLMAAAGKGDQEVVKLLLDNVDPKRDCMTEQQFIDIKDKYGNTAVHFASEGGSLECFGLILQAGGKFSQVNWAGETPLMVAAREGKHEVVEYILENFIAKRENMTLQDYINIEDKIGRTAMYFAAQGGSVECVQHLFQAGGKLFHHGDKKETPLRVATRNGKLEVAKWLLNNFNAESEGLTLQDYIDIEDEFGRTVMHLAAWRGSVKCLELLVGAGGKLSQVSLNGETPLTTAAREGKQEVVEWLLDNFNEEREGMTVPHYIDIKNKDGRTALSCAVWEGYMECVKLLVKAGGKLVLVDNSGETPLMKAARQGRLEIVEFLLNNFNEKREGMTLQDYIDIEDRDGRNASFWAG